jgi:hypothetical protein
VTVNVTVKVPVWACVGVHVKVPLGEIPDATGKEAPVGSWEPEMARTGAGIDVSVALTVNVRVESALTVCVEGRLRFGAT